MQLRLARRMSVLLFLTLSSTAIAQPPSAEEVLGRALDALGGAERLARVESREMTGELEVAGLRGPYRQWTRTGDKLRVEIDLEVVKIERGFDGTAGWEWRNGSSSPPDAAALERLARQARFNPLLSFKQGGASVKLIGQEQLGGREVWVLEVRPESGADTESDAGRRERFFFDTGSFLPLREVRMSGTEAGQIELTVSYRDYRLVDGFMMPFSIVTERSGQVQTVTLTEIKVDQPQPDGLYDDPASGFAGESFVVSLSTIPRRVFKENDGVWEDVATESWVFHLVVNEAHGRPLEPLGAVLESYSGQVLVERLELSPQALAALRAQSFTGLAAQAELFDLRHHHSRPVELEIDRLLYRLRLATANGEEIEQTLEIPLERYPQKTGLIFPLRGKFTVVGGHAFNEPHKGEWSQHYADDVVALGDNYEMMRGPGAKNEDFVAWGVELIAPAAGTVVYARNDVPDNPRPGVIETDQLRALPDVRNAIGGNNVILDHGNGEFSFLAHMIHGSVQVKTGDVVRQGQVLGRLGNSGNSDGPHLHYHLMAGPELMRSDGLPARFDNVYLDLFAVEGEALPTPRPKRGVPLVAR